MNTSLLIQELEPLNERIEHISKHREMLANELRAVQKDLEAFAEERRRFEALRDVCNALGKLGELEAGELFWGGIPERGDVAGHLAQLRDRIESFEGQIRGFVEKQIVLQEQIERGSAELDFLNEEIRDAYDREERRQEEFLIEREISSVPDRTMIMPWTKEAESEGRFRRSLALALLICIIFGTVIPLIKVPIPDRMTAVIEIPQRLAMLVKKEPAMAPARPAPQKPPEEIKEEVKKEAEPTKPKVDPQTAEQPKTPSAPKPAQSAQPIPEPKPGAAGGGTPSARQKAEQVGVLAFKNTFKDLMVETPVARIGTEAHLSKESPRAAGQAIAQRSLVAMQAAAGSSGGIANAGVSRSLGSGSGNRLGGSGVGRGGYGDGTGTGTGSGSGSGRVQSAIAGIQEAARPLSDGPGPGRTDEEIQIVFDRYKATLYRIYNRELRKDPTLRGKILLRIIIETDGSVSLCKVESTDLGSPELVARIVERIQSFNFGPKESVPKITILYPIDFLPAG